MNVSDGQQKEWFATSVAHVDLGIPFWRNTIVRTLIFGWGVLFFGATVMSIVLGRPKELFLILHYNVYFGVDVLGAWWQIYFLLITVSVFTLINGALAFRLYENRERILAYLFLFGSFLLGAGLDVALGGLLYANY